VRPCRARRVVQGDHIEITLDPADLAECLRLQNRPPAGEWDGCLNNLQTAGMDAIWEAGSRVPEGGGGNRDSLPQHLLRPANQLGFDFTAHPAQTEIVRGSINPASHPDVSKQERRVIQDVNSGSD